VVSAALQPGRFRPLPTGLAGDELSFVLTQHWRKLGLTLDEADLTDMQAIASTARITGPISGSFTACSCKSSASVEFNSLSVITDDIVEAARSTLVIGTTWRHTRRRNPPFISEGHTTL